MKAVQPKKIADGITYVGAADPNLRIFDVIMSTEYGTTYNSYFIEGTKARALVEVVKEGFGDEQIAALQEMTDLASLEYIILDHTEPDHSGAFYKLLDAAPDATVVATRAGMTLARELANRPFKEMIVKDGDSIDLGGKTLQFIMAPFLHWPDTMFTYVKEDKALISGDVFGCHYGLAPAQYDDEVKDDISQVRAYYFEVIMSPFKPYMLKAMDKLEGLAIDQILPSHGPLMRGAAVGEAIDLMRKLSAPDTAALNRAFVAYVSSYGNTKKLAETIAQGLQDAGVEVDLQDLTQISLEDALARVANSGALIVGSPTFNRDALPPVWQFLTSLSALANRDKVGAAFGSYGWSGEAAPMIEERLRSIGLKIVQPAARAKLRPSQQELEGAKALAAAVAEKMKK